MVYAGLIEEILGDGPVGKALQLLQNYSQLPMMIGQLLGEGAQLPRSGY